ncbi:roadblock/LC7 domain-containing protein [Acidithiobacillus sulfuriphilus]|uniref:Roadblock/LC7 domain-containing protein n=2 Tax=Acidithiobacillus sulfuriphilus TaxID=1867749 RepID=A0ACD5HJU2_9PROT|nr:roadblock/LC7 domain-containing protein [Acidithiobacillus sulfuriphilus]
MMQEQNWQRFQYYLGRMRVDWPEARGVALLSSDGLFLHSENLPDDDGLSTLLSVFSAIAEMLAQSLGYGDPCRLQVDLLGAQICLLRLEAELYGVALLPHRAPLPSLVS